MANTNQIPAAPTEAQLSRLKPREEAFLARWKEIRPDVAVTFRHYVAYNIEGRDRRFTALLLRSSSSSAKEAAVDLWCDVNDALVVDEASSYPIEFATEYPADLNLSEPDLLCLCALRCATLYLGLADGPDALWRREIVDSLGPTSLDAVEFMLALLRAGVAARQTSQA